LTPSVMLKLISFVCSTTPETGPIRQILSEFVLCTDLDNLLEADESKEVFMNRPELMFHILKTLAEELRPERSVCGSDWLAKAIVRQECGGHSWHCHCTGPSGSAVVVRSFFPGVKVHEQYGQTILR
jgi:hypothetical protein